jgi:hypothetical protein
VAKLRTQLICHFEGLQPRCDNDVFIDVETHHTKAVRIVVKFEMEVAKHPSESIANRFQADVMYVPAVY